MPIVGFRDMGGAWPFAVSAVNIWDGSTNRFPLSKGPGSFGVFSCPISSHAIQKIRRVTWTRLLEKLLKSVVGCWESFFRSFTKVSDS